MSIDQTPSTRSPRAAQPTSESGRLGRGALQGRVMVGATLLVLVGTVGSVFAVEATLTRRAIGQEMLAARVITALTVDRNLTDLDGGLAALSAEQMAQLDGDVTLLVQRGDIVGLEVWGRDGRLLYADGGRGDDEPALPASQLRRALAGSSFVASHTHRDSATDVLDVVQPVDPGKTGTWDGVVEVLLPHTRVDAAVDSSVRRLWVAAFLLILAFVWLLRSMRRRLRQRMFEAEHDPLTGLGNRSLLARRGVLLPPLRERCSAFRSDTALLLVDLDGFKRVNDALGHGVGDDVLVVVAERLRSVTRTEEEVVRLGGDEFAILLTSLGTDHAADRVAQRILAALTEPVTVGPVSVQIGASIGIALRSADLDLGELLRRADVAMYQAKRAGGGFLHYTSLTDDNSADNLTLLSDVRQAIANDEFFLEYQPKMDSECQVTGVEALVRWMHPTRGVLPPGDFLPLVEETALMKPLTVWVMCKATAQAALWRANGLDLPVAVNVSPRTLLDTDFLPLVTSALEVSALPGSSLTVEITETAILDDPQRARTVIQELREAGVGVSIDDFGTGFTSLAHLKMLPISEIKIDGGFVRGLLEHGADHSIVAYTIGLAHDLRIPVVAEGVEAATELDELRSLGCDGFQGYLIARPLAADDVDMWLRAHRATFAAPVV